MTFAPPGEWDCMLWRGFCLSSKVIDPMWLLSSVHPRGFVFFVFPKLLTQVNSNSFQMQMPYQLSNYILWHRGAYILKTSHFWILSLIWTWILTKLKPSPNRNLYTYIYNVYNTQCNSLSDNIIADPFITIISLLELLMHNGCLSCNHEHDDEDEWTNMNLFQQTL